jgi:predicted dienelactone hydrolase
MKWGAVLVLVSAAWAQEPYKKDAGPCRVEVKDEVWRDEARTRDVPVRVYLPEIVGKAPVIIVSHGMGGRREGYRYFGEHMASHGYLVVHPQHAGSDLEAVLEEGREQRGRGRPLRRLGAVIEENTSDPDNLVNRPRDVSFVIDRLGADAAWAARADLERVGVAGHSFGAYTSMAVAGQLVDLPGEPDRCFRDERVRAAIAMSPQGPGVMGQDLRSWDGVSLPIFFMTGTKDGGQGGREPAWRRVPFDRVKGPDAYFLCIEDATHMTFSDAPGARLRTGAERNPAHHGYILMASTAFFDAYLRDDAAAGEWLRSDALAKLSAGAAPIEARAAEKK